MDLCYVNVNSLKELKYEKQGIVIRKHSSKIHVSKRTGKLNYLNFYYVNGKAFTTMNGNIISIQGNINDKELKLIKRYSEIGLL